MCKVSKTHIHWCWRYLSGRTKFSNILSILANKNGDKSATLNLIGMKLHKIHGRIVINACVKYRKKNIIIFKRTDKSWTDAQTNPNPYPPQIFFLVGENNVSITYIFRRKLLFCHMSLTNFTIIFDALVIIKINCSMQVSLGKLSKIKYLSLISFKHLH